MIKSTATKFLDTSAWVDYFEGSIKITKIVDSDADLATSAISFLEMRRKLLREKVSIDVVHKIMDFMENRASVSDVTQEIAQSAADYSYNQKLHAVDAVIYASAQLVNAVLLTADFDFKGLPGVDFIR